MRDLFRKTRLPTQHAFTYWQPPSSMQYLRVGSQMPQSSQLSSPIMQMRFLLLRTPRGRLPRRTRVRPTTSAQAAIALSSGEVTELVQDASVTHTNSPMLFRFAIRIADKDCCGGHLYGTRAAIVQVRTNAP